MLEPVQVKTAVGAVCSGLLLEATRVCNHWPLYVEVNEDPGFMESDLRLLIFIRFYI